MRFNAFLPLEGLTRIASCCLIVKRETHDDPQSPRQTRRRTALHHPDSPRLLAPSPHPASHRLRRLRPRTRPLGLGLDRQLSRRTHQAAQPLRRTKIHGPTVVAQLPETEGHLGAQLRVEPATLAPGEESMTRIAEPQLGFADLELRNQGVHLDPLLQGIVGFLVPQELRRAHPGRHWVLADTPDGNLLLLFLLLTQAASGLAAASLDPIPYLPRFEKPIVLR